MIIEIDKDHLLKSVIIADSVISSKPVNPLLANCCFNVTENNIEIIATDNEIAVKTYIDAISDSKKSFTCNGKRLSQILKEFPVGNVIIDINESNIIKINSKSGKIKGSYKLIGTSAEEFPEIISVSSKNMIEFDQVVLKEMIKKVIYAASTDSIKPVFNGIFFKTDGNKISTVASDSRRLSIVTKEIENNIKIDEGIIIPLKTIHEIYKLLNAGKCIFSVQDKQCCFKIGDTEIISRLIDGQFPNYKQVIPKDFKAECIVDNKLFMESLRRAMIFSKEPTYKIICKFTKNNLHIEAKTPELGEAEEYIDIELKGEEDITLGINAQYIMESVKEIDSLGLKISLTGQMSPVTFMSENDSSYIAVIMPIQIKNAD
ncbi:MAG: DNA polymerase III subunit beta [Spirochaetes bacterium]|nr:DNA polymerase III subunit beta [Spirochaetota bacterium]